MMTPPNGSAEASGMNDSVSSEARHRKELTPMPPPRFEPPPLPPPSNGTPPPESCSIRDSPGCRFESEWNMEQAERAAAAIKHSAAFESVRPACVINFLRLVAAATSPVRRGPPIYHADQPRPGVGLRSWLCCGDASQG